MPTETVPTRRPAATVIWATCQAEAENELAELGLVASAQPVLEMRPSIGGLLPFRFALDPDAESFGDLARELRAAHDELADLVAGFERVVNLAETAGIPDHTP